MFFDYTKIFNYEQIKTCANNIEIMSGKRQDNKRVAYSRELIKNAKRLIFLGFGFDDFNMETLGFPTLLKDKHDVFWTQKGLNQRGKDKLAKLFIPNGEQTTRKPIDGNSLDLVEQYIF